MPGRSTVSALRIPVEVDELTGRYLHQGMCVVNGALNCYELVAFAFLNEQAVDLFNIKGNSLVPVKHISLNFKPSELLWIGSKASIIVSDNAGNKGNLQQLVLGEEAQANQVAFDGSEITAFSWCLLNAKNGEEKKIILFDGDSENLVAFEMA